MRRFPPFLLASLVFSSSAAWASRPLLDVPLVWRPTSTIQDFRLEPVNLTPFREARIAVLPFTDSCPDKTLIGQNQEDAQPKLVRTNADVAGFVEAHTKDILSGLGYPMVDKADQANVTLSGEVVAFTVVERNTYVGDVRIKLTVRRGQEVVWEGMALGQATRFGRSYKLENYYEVLSDSLLEAIARMGASQGFQQAFVAKPPTAPTAASATAGR